jgi:hypothetical protein
MRTELAVTVLREGKKLELLRGSNVLFFQGRAPGTLVYIARIVHLKYYIKIIHSVSTVYLQS